MGSAGEASGAPEDSGVAAFASLLVAHPQALVTALRSDGGLVPPPAALGVDRARVFERGSGLDLVVPPDHPVVFAAWERAVLERVVELQVHLVAAPERLATLWFVDARDEVGVHLIVVDGVDRAAIVESIEVAESLRRRVGRVRRDALGVFLEVDEATTLILGWSRAELIGRRTLDFIHPDDVDGAVDSWMAMRAGRRRARTQARFRHADGRYLWLEVVSEDHLDDPDRGCVDSEVVDISAAMADLEALHERERLLQRLAEALPIGLCHLHADRSVLYANAPWTELLGPVDSVDALVRSVAGPDRPLVQMAVERALDGWPSEIEVGVLHGFEERRCELTFRTLANDRRGVDGVIVCAADVTDRSRLRAELEHRASHDALSGCLNRAATVTALERALREGRRVTVAYIDLDHFKATNDELGHAAGDELLRVAAARLRSVIRVEDRLGRIGGDEFVVICPQGAGPFEAAALVERLTEAVCGDVAFARQRIPLQASIGAASSHDGELDAEALLSRADAAMYEAKRRARRHSSGLVPLPRPGISGR